MNEVHHGVLPLAEESWNSATRCTQRVAWFETTLGGKNSVAVHVPRLIDYLPTLDLDLLNYDLGWKATDTLFAGIHRYPSNSPPVVSVEFFVRNHFAVRQFRTVNSMPGDVRAVFDMGGKVISLSVRRTATPPIKEGESRVYLPPGRKPENTEEVTITHEPGRDVVDLLNRDLDPARISRNAEALELVLLLLKKRSLPFLPSSPSR